MSEHTGFEGETRRGIGCSGSPNPDHHDLGVLLATTVKGENWGCLRCPDIITLPHGQKPRPSSSASSRLVQPGRGYAG